MPRPDFHRLSIAKLKPEFTGWDHYTELIEQIPKTRSLDIERDQAYFATIFELGCRAREVLGIEEHGIFVSPPLKRKNFLFTKPDRLIIVDVPILKRYEKIDHSILKRTEIPRNTAPAHRKLWHKNDEGIFERKVWETKRLYDTRRIEIPLDEPLLKYVIPFVKKSEDILFTKSYSYYYKLCRQLNPLQNKYPKVPDHIFLHWWRSQRACQLAAEYGFTLHELISFFEWKSMKIASDYAKLAGGLADKMSAINTVWRKD